MLILSARSTHDKISHSQPVATPGVSEDVVNPDGLSMNDMQNRNRRGTQMPHGSSSEPKKVPFGIMGSQQTMTSPARVERHAFNGIGAQFKGHQPFPNCAELTDHITRDADRHHGHQDSLPRLEMSRGVFQDLRYSNSGPLTRFLLETSTQQPPLLVDRSNGQPSSGGGYWHRSSPATK